MNVVLVDRHYCVFFGDDGTSVSDLSMYWFDMCIWCLTGEKYQCMAQ